MCEYHAACAVHSFMSVDIKNFNKNLVYVHALQHHSTALKSACVLVISRVTKDLIVKITDCALSRDRYPEDYWRASGMQRPLPVRWMALESLEIDVFTFKSDVVS